MGPDRVVLECTRSYGELDRILATVDEFCQEAGCSDPSKFAVRLAVEELFTNLVKYNLGSVERITIEFGSVPGAVSVLISDYDVESFDITEVPAVDTTDLVRSREPGGLGLHLVKSYMDSIDYEYSDRTMRITITKQLECGK